jgi:3-deoxy-7-phosphoheptulonate synthase
MLQQSPGFLSVSTSDLLLMSVPTSDLRIRTVKPLVTPAILENELPLDDGGAAFIARTRAEIGAIIAGEDDRLLVVAGPCSIHDPAAALEYAGLLREAASRHAGELLVVMRAYYEKPRTVTGWRGLINDPDLDDTYEVNRGLRLARKLMVDINRLGVPVATEFLDTTLGQYYADLVSWGAIGARTVESQVHRELASGLSMPVGFKNRTDGDLRVAVNAIRSARLPHWFPSITRMGEPAVLGTSGNDQTHLVLRGGSHGPNYSEEHVRAAVGLLKEHDLAPFVMIDCSHANSGKDPERQCEVARGVSAQVAGGSRAIAGVMVEGNLVGGAQNYRNRPLVYGRSITDACLPWEMTLTLLAGLAGAVRARRGR